MGFAFALVAPEADGLGTGAYVGGGKEDVTGFFPFWLPVEDGCRSLLGNDFRLAGVLVAGDDWLTKNVYPSFTSASLRCSGSPLVNASVVRM